MPVKHALLALLAERDLTGYELKNRFERVIGDFWQLNSGQVYSTLERMRRCGLVSRQAETAPSTSTVNGSRTAAIERAKYTLLPRGRRLLEHWLAAPVDRLRPVRDPLYVKLAFTTPERVPTLLASLATEARRYGAAVETLAALVAREPLSHTGRTRWLVTEATRLTYQAQLQWIESARRLLSPSSADGAAPRPVLRTAHQDYSLKNRFLLDSD